jgi:hypothetical protein
MKFCKGGAAARVVLLGYGERKSHIFFLSMYLYPLLNEGRLCLDVEYSYPSIF